MTVTDIAPEAPRPSRLLASEIRAEMGRAGINSAELARRLHVSRAWTSRRLGLSADIDITLDEVVLIAEALGLSTERLMLAVLPRLDSNQQPSGYPYTLVSRLADVVELAPWREARAS